jgi:hypothetical protein
MLHPLHNAAKTSSIDVCGIEQVFALAYHCTRELDILLDSRGTAVGALQHHQGKDMAQRKGTRNFCRDVQIVPALQRRRPNGQVPNASQVITDRVSSEGWASHFGSHAVLPHAAAIKATKASISQAIVPYK